MTAATGLVVPPLRRQPEFLKLWAGQTISVFGDAITFLALPLAGVLLLDASAAEMGFLAAAGLFPHLLFSLAAGVWIDRHARRRRFLVAADLGRAALLAWIPLAHVLGVLALEQLYAVAFLVGALTVVFDVSYSSLFALVVPRRDVVDANSKLSLSRSASWIGGQPLAGALVQAFTAPFAILLDAVSFVVSAVFVGSIRLREPPVEHRVAGVRRQLMEGVRFLLGQPILRAGLLCAATVNFFNFAFLAIFVLFATEELGVSPGLLGAVLGAGAIGAALGALVAPAVERRIGIGPTYVLGAVLFPAPLLLVPAAGGPLWLIGAFLFASEFLAGVGVMLFDVPGNSINLLLTPQRIRARTVGAHRTLNYGVRPLGALTGGFLGSAIGLRPTLWIATAGALLGVLFLFGSPIPGLREPPEEAA
jgi:MFS family permease